MSSPVALDVDAVVRALTLRDLTDPAAGAHAVQLVLDEIVDALARRWGVAVERHRALPIVTARDNYQRLYVPEDAAALDARYTRWLGPGVLLRTQTSAMIPPLLDRIAAAGPDAPGDVLLCCAGLVYRRDAINRTHVGEPHQVDLWRVRRGPLDGGDLREMIDAVVAAALPGWPHRVSDAVHPYTVGGLQIDVEGPDGWVEIGECGLAHPRLLADAGLPRETCGLAMGLGLDRLVMLRKGIADIRLLRAADPRIARQMMDLAPYRAVSMQPAIARDLSIAVDAGEGVEDLGDRVRAALGPRADAVEEVTIVSTTPYDALPDAARARLGISPAQHNLLVRVVLRDPSRALTHGEANELRDAIYAALHRGSVGQWAARERRSLPW
jgi:phenylalanyl-tRNA synthetase alpha chain